MTITIEKTSVKADGKPEAKFQAGSEAILTDSTGRKIKIKEPELLERFDFIALLENEKTANRAYMMLVENVLWVKEIDGEKINMPQTSGQLRFLIQRLGNAGYSAIVRFFNTLSQEDDSSIGDNTAAQGDQEAVKKSQEISDSSSV